MHVYYLDKRLNYQISGKCSFEAHWWQNFEYIFMIVLHVTSICVVCSYLKYHSGQMKGLIIAAT